MAIAKRPSKVTLPPVNQGWGNLLEFLSSKFPLIDEGVWINRFKEGKVHWLSGEVVAFDTPFIASKILCYYREVEAEPKIPFEHQVIEKNEHFLIACKPHFLPVTPGGQYVNECLLERIRQQEKVDDIVPVHRLDRETAGLVMFSINPETRGKYCQLFAQQQISKNYLAVAEISPDISDENMPMEWNISNRLEKSQPAFIMQEVEGLVNARSSIKLIEKNKGKGLFNLSPITGKTHQLRLHMLKIGMPILNDKFYPVLKPKENLNFSQPLQLLAKSLQFVDPINGYQHRFVSERNLDFW